MPVAKDDMTTLWIHKLCGCCLSQRIPWDCNWRDISEIIQQASSDCYWTSFIYADFKLIRSGLSVSGWCLNFTSKDSNLANVSRKMFRPGFVCFSEAPSTAKTISVASFWKEFSQRLHKKLVWHEIVRKSWKVYLYRPFEFEAWSIIGNIRIKMLLLSCRWKISSWNILKMEQKEFEKKSTKKKLREFLSNFKRVGNQRAKTQKNDVKRTFFVSVMFEFSQQMILWKKIYSPNCFENYTFETFFKSLNRKL